MKSNLNTNQNLNEFEKRVMKHLNESGYSFPKNEEELEKFNELFGNTSFDLPEELQNPIQVLNKGLKIIPLEEEELPKLSFAARDGNFSDISDELLTDLESDFDKKIKKK